MRQKIRSKSFFKIPFERLSTLMNRRGPAPRPPVLMGLSVVVPWWNRRKKLAQCEIIRSVNRIRYTVRRRTRIQWTQCWLPSVFDPGDHVFGHSVFETTLYIGVGSSIWLVGWDISEKYGTLVYKMGRFVIYWELFMFWYYVQEWNVKYTTLSIRQNQFILLCKFFRKCTIKRGKYYLYPSV